MEVNLWKENKTGDSEKVDHKTLANLQLLAPFSILIPKDMSPPYRNHDLPLHHFIKYLFLANGFEGKMFAGNTLKPSESVAQALRILAKVPSRAFYRPSNEREQQAFQDPGRISTPLPPFPREVYSATLASPASSTQRLSVRVQIPGIPNPTTASQPAIRVEEETTSDLEDLLARAPQAVNPSHQARRKKRRSQDAKIKKNKGAKSHRVNPADDIRVIAK